MRQITYDVIAYSRGVHANVKNSPVSTSSWAAIRVFTARRQSGSSVWNCDRFACSRTRLGASCGCANAFCGLTPALKFHFHDVIAEIPAGRSDSSWRDSRTRVPLKLSHLDISRAAFSHYTGPSQICLESL